MTYRLAFTEDPAALLEAAASYLAAEPVVTTVVSTVTERAARDRAAGNRPPDHPCWWVSVHDIAEDDRVVGVAMRTAPFLPYPLFVLPMPDDAARAIADALVARDEVVTGVNGALPAAQVIVEALAEHAGSTAAVDTHMRLHVLGELVEPTPPPGLLRAADARRCRAEPRVVPGLRRRGGGAGGPTAWPRWRPRRPRRDRGEDRPPGDLALGGPDRRGRAPHRPQPTVLRRRPGRSGLHAVRSARARVRQCRSGRGVPDAAGRRGRRLPVHRPGQPRPRTRSTQPSATRRSSTWPTWSSAAGD